MQAVAHPPQRNSASQAANDTSTPKLWVSRGSSLRAQAAAAALDASIYRKRQAAASAPKHTQAHEPSPTTRNASKHSKQQTAAGTPKHAQASKPTPTTHNAFQHRKQQTATSTPKRRPPGHRHGPLMRGEANKHKRPADGARVGHDLALKTEAHHAGSLPLRTENIAAHARRPKASAAHDAARCPLKLATGTARSFLAKTRPTQATPKPEGLPRPGGRRGAARPTPAPSAQTPPQAPSSPYNRLKKKKPCDSSRH